MNMQFADPQLAIGMPGPAELFIILMIVLVVFGARKLPEMGEGLGKGIKNFKKAFEKDEQSTTATPVEPKSMPTAQETPASEQYAQDKDHQSS